MGEGQPDGTIERLRSLGETVDGLLQSTTPYEPPVFLMRSGEEICRQAVALDLLTQAELEGACDDRLVRHGLRLAFARRFQGMLSREMSDEDLSQALGWAQEALGFVKDVVL